MEITFFSLSSAPVLCGSISNDWLKIHIFYLSFSLLSNRTRYMVAEVNSNCAMILFFFYFHIYAHWERKKMSGSWKLTISMVSSNLNFRFYAYFPSKNWSLFSVYTRTHDDVCSEVHIFHYKFFSSRCYLLLYHTVEWWTNTSPPLIIHTDFF